LEIIAIDMQELRIINFKLDVAAAIQLPEKLITSSLN
jgi:hypothetical protein